MSKKLADGESSTPALSSTFRATNFDDIKEKFPNYLVGVKFNLDGEDSKNIEKISKKVL